VGISIWLHTAVYRLWQVSQQLGFVAPLSTGERTEIARCLPVSAIPLFETMSAADQQHALRVCRGLQARGCAETDLLAAALLHDIGKAGGRVPFWTRPVIVIGKVCFPRLLARLAVYPGGREGDDKGNKATPIPSTPPWPLRMLMSWRCSLGYAWWHADIGADLAAAAGLSERAVLYIRTHHQSDGPAAVLYCVDEAS
jgi:hypothetical protein